MKLRDVKVGESFTFKKVRPSPKQMISEKISESVTVKISWGMMFISIPLLR